MMNFLQVLMKRAAELKHDETQVATGTYADGIFPLTLEEAPNARFDRLRLSYQRDLTTASRLAEEPAVFG